MRTVTHSLHSKWLRPLPIGRSLRGSSSVSRILSRVTIYLWPPVAGRLMRPTRRLRASSPRTPPYSALHRVGLAWPPCHHGAGALLPHHFTFATETGRRSGPDGVLCNFCGAFPRVSPAGRYPAPCSAVSGLSSKIRLRGSLRLPELHSRLYQRSDTPIVVAGHGHSPAYAARATMRACYAGKCAYSATCHLDYSARRSPLPLGRGLGLRRLSARPG